MIKKLPHQDTIKEHFSYRADGNLIWKKKLNPRAPEIFNKRLNVERILSKKLMFNNMTTKTNEVEEYKKGLSDICKMSGIGMCPGCGLTPEGLEKLTALEVEYEKKEAYAQGWNEGQQALKEETSLAVEKERERIWEKLQGHTIREHRSNMTDWIDWNDVCAVFGKETELEKRIKEKEEELAKLKSLTPQ